MQQKSFSGFEGLSVFLIFWSGVQIWSLDAQAILEWLPLLLCLVDRSHAYPEPAVLCLPTEAAT